MSTLLSLSHQQSYSVHHIAYEISTYMGYAPIAKTFHSHDYLLITMIDALQGSCEYLVGDRVYPVVPGDMVLIDPGVPHRKRISPGGRVQEIFLCVHGFSIASFPSSCAFHAKDHHIFPLSPATVESYRTLASTVFSSPVSTQSTTKTLQEVLFSQGFFLQTVSLIVHSQTAAATGAVSPSTIGSNLSVEQMLYFYIQSHYMENLCFSRFAADYFISKESLGRNFRQKYQMSPRTYQVQLRMHEACRLLKRQEHPVAGVAELVGYGDVAAFSKAFKKVYGITPTAFQHQHKITLDTLAFPVAGH